jgi:hypothetical protein
MPEGRGKKTKKARWQLTLGMKQVICGALGVTWMMMIIFILGVLAGRGDIYRWLSGWGLITPVSSKVAQWSPPAEAPAGAVKSLSPGPETAAAPGTKARAASTSAARPGPVTGSIAPASSPAAVSRSKKTSKGTSHRDHKAREEELRRLRREVAPKLKFQNSFDSKPPKTARTTLKKKGAAPGQKAQSRQVRVAQYRDLKAAKAKMAELQKKGEKVALKKGKDKNGAYYEIFRETQVKKTPENIGLAQKAQKSGGNKSKKKARMEN